MDKDEYLRTKGRSVIKERISPSLGRNLLTMPIPKVIYGILNRKPTTSAMSKGLNFEYLLEYGFGKVRRYDETKTKGVKYHAWASTLEEDEIGMIASEYADALFFYKCAQEQGITDLVRDMLYQEHFEKDDFHGYCDWSDDDKLIEMKVTSKAGDWRNACIREHYDLQAYLQSFAFDHKKDFYWLVIDEAPPYVATLWMPDQFILDSGKTKYHKVQRLFKELNEWSGHSKLSPLLLEAPQWIKPQ